MNIVLAASNGGGDLRRLVVDRDLITSNDVLRYALEHSHDGDDCKLFFPKEASPALKKWLLAKSAPSEWTPLTWLSSVLNVRNFPFSSLLMVLRG